MPTRLSFLVFGDSIAYGFCDADGGWVQRLRRMLDQKNAREDGADYRVYNLGIPGETSDELLRRFDGEFEARIRNGQCIALLAIGINDAKYLQNERRPKSTIDRLSENLRQLIAKTRARGADVVVVGLTRIDGRYVTSEYRDPNISFHNSDIDRYDTAIAAVCEGAGTPCVRLSDIEWSNATLEDDGLHPNTEGHTQIFNRVRDALAREGFL